MKHIRPPVPKFNEDCPTPKQSLNLLEEVQHLIYSMKLNQEIEQKALRVVSTCRLPKVHSSALGIVYYCMKQMKLKLPPRDKKVEYVIKYIELHQSQLIEVLCEKLGFDEKLTSICSTLLHQLQHLIRKLPIQLQNAISVKIATDIVFFKKGGLNTKYLAYYSKISEEQIKLTINRISPFAESIMRNLFNYYNTNPL